MLMQRSAPAITVGGGQGRMVCFSDARSKVAEREGDYSRHTRPIDGLHDLVLRWYDRNHRDLPWRLTRDPYRILVSEIMLQQTQVDRVIPKYEQFLERFPTVSDLASASLAEVLRIWSPLGYNRRARYLHLAAKAAQDRFGGSLPKSLSDLRSLPGIGRYTAGAVACFAYEQEVPIVDTNIRRVLGRIILGQRDGVGETVAWKLAHAALARGNVYNWNQALMDLGATVCDAESPRCLICPAMESCQWRSSAVSNGTTLRRVREPRAAYGPTDPGASRRRWRGRITNALRASNMMTSWSGQRFWHCSPEVTIPTEWTWMIYSPAWSTTVSLNEKSWTASPACACRDKPEWPTDRQMMSIASPKL